MSLQELKEKVENTFKAIYPQEDYKLEFVGNDVDGDRIEVDYSIYRTIMRETKILDFTFDSDNMVYGVKAYETTLAMVDEMAFWAQFLKELEE